MLKAQHPIPLRSLLNPSGVPWNTSASYSRIAQQAGLENTDLSGPYWIGTTPYSLFDLKGMLTIKMDMYVFLDATLAYSHTAHCNPSLDMSCKQNGNVNYLNDSVGAFPT